MGKGEGLGSIFGYRRIYMWSGLKYYKNTNTTFQPFLTLRSELKTKSSTYPIL